MLMLKMSYLNLWRRRSRTVIVMAMIALSLSGLLFLQGIYDGMAAEMIRNTVRTEAGHLVVEDADFARTKRLTDSVGAPGEIVRAFAASDLVAGSAWRISVDGIAASGRSSRGVRLIGIDASAERGLSAFAPSVTEGTFTLHTRTRPQAAIGVDLAEKLGVGVGSKVIVTAQSTGGSLVSAAFTVEALLRTNNPAIDKNAVITDRAFAASLLGSKNRATRVIAFLHDAKRLEEARAALSGIAPEGAVLSTWKDLYPMLTVMQDSMTGYNAISYGIVFVVVAFGILDILLISVIERMREYGIMKALGTPFHIIAGGLVLESLIAGAMGLAGGIALGGALLALFSRIGLNLSAWASGMQSFGLGSIIYPEAHLSYFITAAVAVFAASGLACLVPVRMLAKAKPVDAITNL